MTETLNHLRHRLTNGKTRQMGYWEQRLVDETGVALSASERGSHVERLLAELEA